MFVLCSATCVFLCLFVCVCVYLIVFLTILGNVQIVNKVRKVTYSAVLYVCQIFLTLESFVFILATMKCVHKCADDLHMIKCNCYCNYIDNTAVTGVSKYFELGQPREF